MSIMKVLKRLNNQQQTLKSLLWILTTNRTRSSAKRSFGLFRPLDQSSNKTLKRKPRAQRIILYKKWEEEVKKSPINDKNNFLPDTHFPRLENNQSHR